MRVEGQGSEKVLKWGRNVPVKALWPFLTGFLILFPPALFEPL